MRELNEYDNEAALAMVRAYGREPTPTVLARLRSSDFWALYEDGPVGAVAITKDSEFSPGIHIGCVLSGRAGHAIKRVVEAALQKHGQLFAEIRNDAPRAVRLALGLGFKPLRQTKTHLVCWREL